MHLEEVRKNFRFAAGLVSVRAVSSPSPDLSHNAVADMDFMFDKAGNVKKEHCFRGHPMLGYDTVRSWFVGVMPSRSYKRHGIGYLVELASLRASSSTKDKTIQL